MFIKLFNQTIKFTNQKGGVTGFIGSNGAGKSTVIKMMMNLLKPDAGEVKVYVFNSFMFIFSIICLLSKCCTTSCNQV